MEDDGDPRTRLGVITIGKDRKKKKKKKKKIAERACTVAGIHQADLLFLSDFLNCAGHEREQCLRDVNEIMELRSHTHDVDIMTTPGYGIISWGRGQHLSTSPLLLSTHTSSNVVRQHRGETFFSLFLFFSLSLFFSFLFSKEGGRTQVVETGGPRFPPWGAISRVCQRYTNSDTRQRQLVRLARLRLRSN